jgi:hypothetical protein
MNEKLKPALIGGVVLGILSVIPFVNWVNICCCLWAVLGGALATHLYVKASPTPVKPGDGAVLGVLAGVFGAIIFVIIGIPVTILMGGVINGIMLSLVQNVDPRQAAMMREQMLAGQTIVGAIIRGLLGAVLLIIFALIGGLIGVPIFEKRKGQPSPPQPPGFPGGTGGYAA